MSSPSKEENLNMVAALSSSFDTDDVDGSNDTTTKSLDEDSEGMATAVTPITTNVSSNTNAAADNESQEVAVDVAAAFSVSSSTSTSTDGEESELEEGAQEEESQVQYQDQDDKVQVDQDDTDEEIPSDESVLTPTTNNVTDTNAADTTDVMYSFPIQEEEHEQHQKEQVDSDINSHQTSLEGVDIAEEFSSVATATNTEDGSAECLPLPSIPSPDSPSNHHNYHQVEVDLAEMEALPSPSKSHDSKMLKKDNGTPVTSNTASDSDASYTDDDDDDSSSNFSTTSGEDSRVSFSYEERDTSFERQAQDAMFAAGDIVHLFMQQQQNHYHKKEERRRKLKRRKKLALERELQTKHSEDDEPQSRRRPPPPSQRRRPRDRVQKTLHYDSVPAHGTNKQEQDDKDNVVPENNKARKEPLNDDYMLQEEIWLNMFCNAVPSSVMNYFKAFGCVKVQKQTPSKSSSRRIRSRPQGSPPHRQPFVTDEEYRKRQHRHQAEDFQQQKQDPKHNFRSRMKEEGERQEAVLKQPTVSISLDEGDHGAHIHSVKTFDQDSSPVQEQQDDDDFLAALELEPPTSTMIDHRSCNLSTILEEGDSQLDGRSLDVIVNYPPNQLPTFAC
ncbi:MAG: hypothetical protein SGBAC_011297 [Bacillariaceae sp.]